MSVVKRKRKRMTVYYVVTRWKKEPYWERVGTERREAERLDARYKAQVKAGTFIPKMTGATTLLMFGRSELQGRRNRTADNDRSLWDNHVERLKWFVAMRVEDIEPVHIHRAIEELKQPYTDADGNQAVLAPKSHGLVCDVIRGVIVDARIKGLITTDPWILKRGMISRRVKNPRTPYQVGQVRTLTTDERIAPDQLVTNAMMAYTAARIGEVCGRRWRDRDKAPRPLPSLYIHTQYQDEPLKTDDHDKARPRMVPEHPELTRILDWWWAEGWELVYRRKPTVDDFIVPRLADPSEARSYSIAYKAWRRGCTACEVDSRTEHALRHTMISQARRGGARKDVLERITHNSQGDVVDAYTHWDWAPLCEAILCLSYGDPAEPGVDATVDDTPKTSRKFAPAAGLEAGAETGISQNPAQSDETSDGDEPPDSTPFYRIGAERSAGQRLAELLAEPRASVSLVLERARREVLSEVRT